uniref:Arrestin C-terminal-like domain-containing protein n=1 Tax=Amphilophus citrinellus TaxID=61819 RepID=A0A3Q0RI52_AMPCI
MERLNDDEMSSIKDLNVTFEAINEDNSYSEGDTIVGTVSFRLTRDVKVKSLSVKAKGDAKAEWTEGVGECQMTYKTKKRYFKLKEYLIAENGKGERFYLKLVEFVVPKLKALIIVSHAFKFRLQIPEGSLPSSFKGKYGKIVYMFEAKISRSCWWSSKVKQKINFISKSFLQFCEKMVNTAMCESLSVVAKICNSSSKDTRPKFKLEQRTVYCCQSNTTESAVTLLQMVGDAVSPNSEQTASCQLKIPEDAIPTLHNCEIISVEYYIKVYLDISFAFDPEVVLPLVIIPSAFATIQPGEASKFASSAFPSGFDPVPTGSGATPDPTQVYPVFHPVAAGIGQP